MRDRIARTLAGQPIYTPLDHQALTGPFGYFGPLFDVDPPAPSGGANGVSFAEYQRLLEKNGQLQRQVDDLTKEKPPAGAVVLTAEEAAQWTIFQTLGKAEEVKSAIAERDTLRTNHEKLVKQTSIAAAAKAAGYDADVLTGLADLAGGKEFEVRTATVGGQVVEVAYIKDGDVFKPLKDYATATWAKFMPSLQAQPAGQQQGSGQQRQQQASSGSQGTQPPAGQQQRQQGSQQFIEQHAGGPPPQGSLVRTLKEEFQQRRNSAVNPLAPQEK